MIPLENLGLPRRFQALIIQSTRQAHNAPDEPTPAAEATAQPGDITPPLAGLIASIRAAVTPSASAEARAAGANACRSILTVLEAKPGQPLAATPQRMPPAAQASPLAALLSQPGLLPKLAAMSRDELIALLKQVTSAMPASPITPTSAAPRFHLIEIPSARRPDGDR
jgi:hypothetical protein